MQEMRRKGGRKADTHSEMTPANADASLEYVVTGSLKKQSLNLNTSKLALLLADTASFEKMEI